MKWFHGKTVYIKIFLISIFRRDPATPTVSKGFDIKQSIEIDGKSTKIDSRR